MMATDLPFIRLDNKKSFLDVPISGVGKISEAQLFYTLSRSKFSLENVSGAEQKATASLRFKGEVWALEEVEAFSNDQLIAWSCTDDTKGTAADCIEFPKVYRKPIRDLGRFEKAKIHSLEVRLSSGLKASEIGGPFAYQFASVSQKDEVLWPAAGHIIETNDSAIGVLMGVQKCIGFGAGFESLGVDKSIKEWVDYVPSEDNDINDLFDEEDAI